MLIRLTTIPIIFALFLSTAWAQVDDQESAKPKSTVIHDYQIAVVGGTPGGIMAALTAARGGCKVVLLERTEHIGGLPANGLGATDIATRGATGGIFIEFVNRIKQYYIDEYGADSKQVIDCSDGYHFEPHVAEQVFEDMLAEQKETITVLKHRQFECNPAKVLLEDNNIRRILVIDRNSG
ncbi:FAD-dependent oxidoreductase, partial [bacterium]|nr:FAD-dependent oxidoreductase [bacterium]